MEKGIQPIDLTQTSDSDDEPAEPAASASTRSQMSSTPTFLLNHQSLIDDPLNAPLINTSHSIAYALSNSVIDPFSNLIRHLHQSNESDKAIFFQLTQNLATNARADNFIPILFQLFEHPQNTVCSVLALQSLRVLSINDRKFCKKVLKRLETILDKFKDNFIIEILQLFITIGQYATEEHAGLILSAIKEKINVSSVDTTLNKHIFPVFAVLSQYGDKFPEEFVLHIKKLLNFPGRPPLNAEIVWPCLICIDNFLAQPQTQAYRILEREKENLLGKLAHATICIEKNNDPDLFMMILKLFLETIDEFKMEKSTNTLKEFHLQLVSSLITLKKSEDDGLSNMADTVLKRLGLLKDA